MIERWKAVAGVTAELQGLNEFLEEFWKEACLPAEGAFPFLLALEEVFANVVMHGTVGTDPVPVELGLAFNAGQVTMTVKDAGPEFDPLSIAAPDVEAPLEERGVGGLGIYLIRELMQAVSYRRVGSQNVLTMSKPVP